MKRLLLAASVCAAFLIVPVASASANNEVVGTCTLSGEANFKGPHLRKSLAESVTGKATEYVFNGEGTCNGKLNGGPAKVEVAAHAHVEGAGTLSCAVSTSGLTPGSGYIEVEGKKAEFTGFYFVGTGPDVTYAIIGSGSAAAGHATFAKDLPALLECAEPPPKEGPTGLLFTAVAVGKVGTNP